LLCFASLCFALPFALRCCVLMVNPEFSPKSTRTAAKAQFSQTLTFHYHYTSTPQHPNTLTPTTPTSLNTLTFSPPSPLCQQRRQSRLHVAIRLQLPTQPLQHTPLRVPLKYPLHRLRTSSHTVSEHGSLQPADTTSTTVNPLPRRNLSLYSVSLPDIRPMIPCLSAFLSSSTPVYTAPPYSRTQQ